MVRFSTNIGNTVGWMGLTTALQIGYLNTAGYPGDKTAGTQWFTANTETDLFRADKLMYTKLDIIPGQSGSPTWELRNNGKRYIKGVVSHQACSSGSVSGSYPGQTCSSAFGYNGIVQFDNTHYNNIRNWR